MATTLAQHVRDEMAALEARYARYKGHHIPCASGEHRYHLSPAKADLCARFGPFRALPPVAWRRVDHGPVDDYEVVVGGRDYVMEV